MTHRKRKPRQPKYPEGGMLTIRDSAGNIIEQSRMRISDTMFTYRIDSDGSWKETKRQSMKSYKRERDRERRREGKTPTP